MRFLALLTFTILWSICSTAQVITGVVVGEDGLPIPGVAVTEVGQRVAASGNFDGRFEIAVKAIPTEILVQALGFVNQRIAITSTDQVVRVVLVENVHLLDEVSVVERRLSEKQKESALTVEALDLRAIHETPSVSFYDGLGNLKGVDLTSASIGFKIINTRGFNSTSPVRSLQLIDGVDNQAPGLNFSLGNFLGASELDVMNVDIIAGASSAFYGPNAFNGVIAMTTKDPFVFQGLSARVKAGERNLTEYSVRWADGFGDRDGEQVFAYKLNFFYLQADDWEATNENPTDNSPNPANNPGGYDAVNTYGDEQGYLTPGSPKDYPALGSYHRKGIEEQYLVDYDTRNLKLGTSLHYKPRRDLELIYAFNFGTGTTVYQGDNRFSLKDILFFQNRIEVRNKGKWFVRAYATQEDAGKSYDAYFTALKMQDSIYNGLFWANHYSELWKLTRADDVRNLPGYPDESLPLAEYNRQMEDFVAQHRQILTQWHGEIGDILSVPELTPGTPEFDALVKHVTETSFARGGSRFEDRSALYHIQGEYRFDPIRLGQFTLGANGRQFRPNSNGTIFSDTNGRVIINSEFGIFGGWEKKFNGEQWKLSATVRLDKNQNFDYLVSPALSAVYNIDNLNSLRFSYSSAIRNPTLQDQYLYYNVGPARLLGNLTGYDSLITIDDFNNFRSLPVTGRQNYQFDYFAVDPVRPERVQTAEVGFRTTLWNALYVDLNYYYSVYRDFIGFRLGIDLNEDQIPCPCDLDVYRISSNSRERVTTQGFSGGLNYYFLDYYNLSGNYTWNVLNTATDDPIIPAFNTPEHKFNVTIGGREIPSGLKNHLFGFNMTYKWIQGFLFEGSPQFTGYIDDYDMLDVQISYVIPAYNLTTKLGASNVLNNRVFQVYGGPQVGRLVYISLTYDWAH